MKKFFNYFYADMKKIIILLLLVSPVANAQEWVRLMQDPSVNFYTVQDAFNKYQAEKERRENNWFNRLFSRKSIEQESPGLEVYKRWEHFNKERVYPTGNRLQPDAIWNEYHNFINRNPDLASPGNWTAMGPSELGPPTGWSPGLGRVNVVAVDPVDSNIIYIGAAAGGLWKSTDGGSTWLQPTTDRLPSIGVSSIAIDYTNPLIIYIGTGDADAFDSYSIGVLKSTDGGLTWSQTGLKWTTNQVRSICKLLIDPVDPNILFAATKDGIYKTTTGGNSWTIVKTGVFRDMEFKPGNSQVIFAAGTSFYRSDDGGNTFNNVTTGLPISTVVDRLSIAVTLADTNYVYVAGGKSTNSGFHGLYKSVDGGITFVVQSNSPNIYGWETDAADVGGQSWYAMTLCVSPTDPEKIYSGGVNIWESQNGGVDWSINAHWLYPTTSPIQYVHADHHFMEFIGSVLYAGCDGGIYKSTDGGINWTDKSTGLSISQFYRIGGAKNDPGLFMAGAQDNGSILRQNGQWSQIIGADGMEVAIDPVNTANIFGAIQYGSIFRSTDGGLTNELLNDSTVNESGDWVTPFMLDPANHNRFYVGYTNVWSWDSIGSTWAKLSNLSGNIITGLMVSDANPDYIYIIRGNSIYKSIDGGGNFTNITTGLPFGLAQLTYIAVHPTDAGKIWVTFSGRSAGNKVFFSPDTGQTWINESINLPNIPVNCIAYLNGTNDGLYIGTDMGVFYKDNTLSAWQPFWNGLPNVVVTELEPNYVSNKLRAGTYGRGAWESDFFILNAPPSAAFTSNHQQICPGDSVMFTDQSLDAAPGWQWVFQGGTPATSSLRNPIVYYNSTGDFDVQLIVQNALGTDTATNISYINVTNPSTSNLPLIEDFESGTFPPAGWSIKDPDGVITWEETVVGGFGNSAHSASVHNFGNSLIGKKDWLSTPLVDLTQLTNPYIKFDVAYARIPSKPDSLAVFYTNNCGITKNYIYKKTGSVLATGGTSVVNFIPTAVQWRTDSVPLPVSAGIVQIVFENTNGYGNNIYVDNINIYSSVTSIGDLLAYYSVSVLPNPANDHIRIIVSGPGIKSEELTVQLFTSNGELVEGKKMTNSGEATFSLEKISSGLYIYHLVNREGLVLKAGKIVHL